MTIALTGASGFVGSYAARSLAARGHRVRALVRASSRRDHIASAVAEFVEGEQHDPDAHRRLVTGVDAVVHNAVDWKALRASPDEHFEKNVLGSLRLLEAARQAGVKQFVFVSSVATTHDISPEWNGRIDETHPTWPGGIYGGYKAGVEAMLKAYHHTYGMNTSAWRPAAIYGVDPDLPRSQWHDLVKAAAAGERVSTDKGGKITHVQDVADAVALAVGDDAVAGEFFNLVDCHIYWQTAAELAKELTGSNAVIEDRKGTGPKNQFDTAKAQAFFDRHGNTAALRRGVAGVREYVAELLQNLSASGR